MHADSAPSLYASPQAALEGPKEEFLYLACLHEGTGVESPDFLAVVDAADGHIVHETPMPNVGDELHHFGWNRCSSACHGPDRSHLIVPGFRSSRIHIVNVADDPRRPRIEKVIEPEELLAKTGYTRPHTVHCMPGDNIVISMLGDADGNGAGGFAVLDAKTFEVKGRWENGGETPPLNYDFWYQPRKNVLISSEFGEPKSYEGGFDLEDVTAGHYGSRLHFWNLAERSLEQTVELGETGLVPLEVRWLHDPDAEEGFVGAALSSTMWRFHRDNGGWGADQVIAVDSIELEGWPFPVPGLITDLVLSMDDRFLYFSNWLHGDLRQYDVSDPAKPEADRAALARRPARQAERRRTRAERRAADAPALVRRAPALRQQLALLDLGQPVLPRARVVAAARELRSQRRDGGRPRLLRRPARPSGWTRARARGAAPGRRLHDGDLPVIVGHVLGIPVEESVLQLAPAGAAILTAVGIAVRTTLDRLTRGVVVSYPSSGFGSRALRTAVGALALVLVTLVWAGAADAEPSGNSAATITASFSDGCRDFTTRATKVGSQQGKDISHVELHYADGRVVKDETINSPDYSLDGAAGDEIDFAIVKSGTTRERFDCAEENSPPTALLEIKTPPVGESLANCAPFWSGGLSCEQSAARTDWTSQAQIPDDGGSESGLFHWVCGFFSHPSLCSYTFSFRGTSSDDPDNDIATWSIDFGDGTSTSGNWSTNPPTEVTHDYSFIDCVGFGTFNFPSVCPVTLTVTDSAGQSDSDTMVMGHVDQTPD